MSQLKFPLCFHPTTVVVVNGDRYFLDEICAKINSNKTIVKPFVNPIVALDYINSLFFAPFSHRCTHELEDDVRNRHSMGINLKLIQNEIYEANRFSQISGVIVDYNMAGMNGLDFCENVHNNHISKILLTRTMDAHLITDAFNRGLINKFVHGDNSSDFKQSLNDTLVEIQYRYFLRYSNMLYNAAISRFSEYQTIFMDPAYIKLFQELLEKYRITEYYLTEACGSYLMCNASEECYLLKIHLNQDPNARILKSENGTYYYSFTSIEQNDFEKKPIFLEQFYSKHPREKVY